MTDYNMITTSTGTTVSVITRDATGDRVVVLDNPAAPADMRFIEAGRILCGGFQPVPDAEFGLTPECLRAVADLCEREDRRAYTADDHAGEVWDPSIPPGGWVCAECGIPVESEPCPTHNASREDH